MVDEEILFDAILHPIVVERELFAPFAFLLRFGNRDKVRTDSPPRRDFIGNPVIAKLEMPRRLLKGRVDDGLLDDDLRHHATSTCEVFAPEAGIDNGRVCTKKPHRAGRCGFGSAPTRTRTLNLMIKSHLLYQLSYRGEAG